MQLEQPETLRRPQGLLELIVPLRERIERDVAFIAEAIGCDLEAARVYWLEKLAHELPGYFIPENAETLH